jgi:hypothetical protein
MAAAQERESNVTGPGKRKPDDDAVAGSSVRSLKEPRAGGKSGSVDAGWFVDPSKPIGSLAVPPMSGAYNRCLGRDLVNVEVETLAVNL